MDVEYLRYNVTTGRCSQKNFVLIHFFLPNEFSREISDASIIFKGCLNYVYTLYSSNLHCQG